MQIKIFFIHLALLIFSIRADSQTEIQSLQYRIIMTSMSAKYDSAIYYAQKLTAIEPSARNYLLQGSVFELKKDYATADHFYQKAVNIAGTNQADIYSALAYVYYNRKNLDKAITYSMQSLKVDNNQPSLHYFVGSVFELLQNKDSAKSHFNKAYQADTLKELYAQKLYNLGYEEGEYTDQELYLKKLIALGNNTLNYQATLAGIYMQQDEYGKAAAILNEILRKSQSDSVYFSLGQCYMELNLGKEAIKCFKKAIMFSAVVNKQYYDALVDAYAFISRPDSVITTYNEGASKGIVSYQQWLINNGGINTLNIPAANQNDFSKINELLFRRDYRRAILLLNDYKEKKVTPKNEFYPMMAAAQFGLRNFNEAKMYITRAIELEPLKEDYQLLYIATLEKLRDYNELIKEANKLQGLSNTGPDFNRFILWKSYIGLKDWKQAVIYK
ncbi:MAG: hypothetical protein JWN76_462 [Chitinophagaceae bacterium]|nr:hypothetical protein [Chitinophagaceae bacterium]